MEYDAKEGMTWLKIKVMIKVKIRRRKKIRRKTNSELISMHFNFTQKRPQGTQDHLGASYFSS